MFLKRLSPCIVLVAGVVLLYVSDRYLAGYTFRVRTETRKVTDIAQVIPVSAPYVRPVLYTDVRGLSTLPTNQAKETFINAVLPAVLVAKHEVNMLLIRLKKLQASRQWTHDDSVVFHTAASRFKAKSVDELLQRVGILPNSIVLAQAAVESGWGQSRIFLEGNNLFGIWSFDPGEPRIAAGQERGKQKVWLRAYNNMSESIVSYFDILSTSFAFRDLRAARAENTADPLALLPYLRNFSERRGAYTRQLRTMIIQNDLTRFDNYELDPDYVFEY